MASLVEWLKVIGLALYWVGAAVLASFGIAALVTGALFALWLVATLLTTMLDPMFVS